MSDCELRCGRWQDVLQDVECDALITDPPYSQRTEDGFRSGSDFSDQCGMGYAPIDESWCEAFADFWIVRTRAWHVVCCDHVAFGWYERIYADRGLYTFPPVIIAKLGAPPRMAGDGPASQVEHVFVARPRRAEFMGSGSRPGWYTMNTVRALNGYMGVRGAKQPELMRALVRDYSREGDLICDPCAGGATTLLAARLEGRRAIGAEMDPNTYAKAQARLSHYPVDLTGAQPGLFGDGT